MVAVVGPRQSPVSPVSASVAVGLSPGRGSFVSCRRRPPSGVGGRSSPVVSGPRSSYAAWSRSHHEASASQRGESCRDASVIRRRTPPVGEGCTTTLMIRNIPCSMTEECIHEALADAGLVGAYEWVRTLLACLGRLLWTHHDREDTTLPRGAPLRARTLVCVCVLMYARKYRNLCVCVHEVVSAHWRTIVCPFVAAWRKGSPLHRCISLTSRVFTHKLS